MPKGDGTGPTGQGPGTGRGQGSCGQKKSINKVGGQSNRSKGSLSKNNRGNQGPQRGQSREQPGNTNGSK